MTSVAGEGWFSAPSLRRVFEVLNVEGGEVRVVGGAVRNSLMGLPAGDIDMATTWRPEEVSERAKAAGIKVVPTGIDHGTVTLVIDGTPYEVTTLRRDVSTDGRRAEVAFGTDWKADAERRISPSTHSMRTSAARCSTMSVGSPTSRRARCALSAMPASVSPRTICAYCGSSVSSPITAAAGRMPMACAPALGHDRNLDPFGRTGLGRNEETAFRRRSRPRASLDAPGRCADRDSAGNGKVGDRRDPGYRSRRAGLRLGTGSAPAPGCDRAAGRATAGGDGRASAPVEGRSRLFRPLGKGAGDPPATVDTAFDRLLYRHGVEGIVVRLRLALATARRKSEGDPALLSETAALRRLLARAEAWKRPSFPLNGGDVLKAGVPAGPRVGKSSANSKISGSSATSISTGKTSSPGLRRWCSRIDRTASAALAGRLGSHAERQAALRTAKPPWIRR